MSITAYCLWHITYIADWQYCILDVFEYETNYANIASFTKQIHIRVHAAKFSQPDVKSF